ncbi:MAG: [Fe-Fe] hydrogenase large subunit C-terminal domain-containing protein [Chitinivibrionales bacterium]
MPYNLPVLFTESAECQDCYKCLRQCPVKAIQVQDGHAAIVHQRCIGCGTCVEACPAGSKRIRNDIERAKLLIRRKEKVFVSLAPSFRAEFPDTAPGAIIGAVKALGVCGVSETAIGAQEVSAATADFLASCGPGPWFSSACPTAVDLVKKYYPDYADRVTNILSPAQVHARLLRKWYGEDIGVIFVGPCIAKKREADAFPQLIDLALTFDEFRELLAGEGIEFDDEKAHEQYAFEPQAAREGALYPVDGGMIAGLKAHCGVVDTHYMAFSGIKTIRRVMEDLHRLEDGKPVFIELLACEGGCVNGPCASKRGGTVFKRFEVIRQVENHVRPTLTKPTVDVAGQRSIEPVVFNTYSEEQIRNALRKVGKNNPEEELNCGGCGYDTCRHFALALLDGKSEASMCAGYMRKLAYKKANALLRTMPGGVVIVNENLEIVESNRRFAEILGSEMAGVYDNKPGLEGAMLEKIVPFASFFRSVVEGGVDMIDKDIRLKDKVLRLSVFPIEPKRLVGGIIQDITEPVFQKERIVQKARDVIEKNLQTVQKIAYLLGENAADSEVILNSIIQSFPTQTVEGE